MKKTIRSLGFVWAVWIAVVSVSVHAEIREAPGMGEIASSVSSETWVIFDLDNTVLRSSQSLGSDPWFSNEVRRGVMSGMTEKEAVKRSVVSWMAVQNATQVVPVEALTPKWISSLQARGILVMALTARPSESLPATMRQLKSLGIDFTRSAPHPLDRTQGILFVGIEGDKGEFLVSFLRQIRRTPEKVIFIDDKAKNVQSVDRALNRAGIPNLDFRYGAADSLVETFDPRISDLQWTEFQSSGRLISDEEARARLPQPAE